LRALRLENLQFDNVGQTPYVVQNKAKAKIDKNRGSRGEFETTQPYQEINFA